MLEMVRVMDAKHPGTKMIYQFNWDNCIPKDHFSASSNPQWTSPL
jgi:hypothetical protein